MDERFSGRLRVIADLIQHIGPDLQPLPTDLPRCRSLEELRRQFAHLRGFTLDELRIAFAPNAPLLWEGDQA